MERDDLILDHQYSLNAGHSEEEGKKARKSIWKVTFILSAITFIEVVMGIIFPKSAMDLSSFGWKSIVIGYLVLTLVKAAYIVAVFMHLGHERKSLKYLVLIPYLIFIVYLAILFLIEGDYLNGALL